MGEMGEVRERTASDEVRAAEYGEGSADTSCIDIAEGIGQRLTANVPISLSIIK